MKTRNLGNTGIKLSEVGYGAAALFGKNVFGKQGITDDYAYEIISTAIKHGVTFFDTGINYGYEEERLGKKSFGSTKSGIAPFYSDKYAKTGIQVSELFMDDDALKEKIARICIQKNVIGYCNKLFFNI